MECVIQNTELSSHEGTRCQFNGGGCAIKLGIDVHQDFYVVVMQGGGANPKPPLRFAKQAFVHWVAKLKSRGAEVHAVYEACGFGFGLQRALSKLGLTLTSSRNQMFPEPGKVNSSAVEAVEAVSVKTASTKSRSVKIIRV
jgi:hypothetical protein